MAKLYPSHHLAQAVDCEYLGTFFQHDVYVTKDTYHLYCVHGPTEWEYESGAGYVIAQSKDNPRKIQAGNYLAAAACALLHHPKWLPDVMRIHTF